jgi:hypothetical protein
MIDAKLITTAQELTGGVTEVLAYGTAVYAEIHRG